MIFLTKHDLTVHRIKNYLVLFIFKPEDLSRKIDTSYTIFVIKLYPKT